MASKDNDSDNGGTARDEQERVIERTARKESWIKMLRRKRKQAKGKPHRHSKANRLPPGDD